MILSAGVITASTPHRQVISAWDWPALSAQPAHIGTLTTQSICVVLSVNMKWSMLGSQETLTSKRGYCTGPVKIQMTVLLSYSHRIPSHKHTGLPQSQGLREPLLALGACPPYRENRGTHRARCCLGHWSVWACDRAEGKHTILTGLVLQYKFNVMLWLLACFWISLQAEWELLEILGPPKSSVIIYHSHFSYSPGNFFVHSLNP